MENQIQLFVIISSIFLGVFILITVYLVVKLKINDLLLKKSEEKLHDFNKQLQVKVEEKTKELQLSEKQFKSLYEVNQEILENSPAGIIKLDKEFNIEFVNPELVNIFGSAEIDIENNNLLKITELNEIKQMQLGKDFEILRSGKDIIVGKNFNRPSGKIVYVEVKAAPLFEGKFFNGAVVLINDITQGIIAEEKLKESYHLLQNATEDIIRAMSATSEMRDPYTAGHQKRVTELAIAISKKMNISEQQKEGVKFAGIVHDIGKISVPSDILSKPGKITKMEYEIIKNHSQVGFELLDQIKFPWPISEIVHQHHERIDGSGYPNNLEGDEILLEAKILSVADVVESMNSHRPYRAALGIDVALKEIEEYKGEKYDTDVVDACKSIFEDDEFSFTS